MNRRRLGITGLLTTAGLVAATLTFVLSGSGPAAGGTTTSNDMQGMDDMQG